MRTAIQDSLEGSKHNDIFYFLVSFKRSSSSLFLSQNLNNASDHDHYPFGRLRRMQHCRWALLYQLSFIHPHWRPESHRDWYYVWVSVLDTTSPKTSCHRMALIRGKRKYLQLGFTRWHCHCLRCYIRCCTIPACKNSCSWLWLPLVTGVCIICRPTLGIVRFMMHLAVDFITVIQSQNMSIPPYNFPGAPRGTWVIVGCQDDGWPGFCNPIPRSFINLLRHPSYWRRWYNRTDSQWNNLSNSSPALVIIFGEPMQRHTYDTDTPDTEIDLYSATH